MLGLIFLKTLNKKFVFFVFFLLFCGWGVFFGENFTDYSFKTQFTTFHSKVCTDLCTYDKINEVTPTINR